MSKELMPGENTDDKFVERDGVKYKADPENLEEALMGEDGQLVPFKEKESEEDKKERERKEKEEDEKDPPLRKSAKDHIIERLQNKRNKSKKKKEENVEDESALEDEEKINKKIQEGLEPVFDRIRGNSDEQELSAVLAKYPEAKKMKEKIKRYMDAYKNTPAEFIYLGLEKQRIDKATRLAKIKDEADNEALEGTTGGTQKRPKKLAKIPDVTKMTDKQVLELAHKVRTGQFGK